MKNIVSYTPLKSNNLKKNKENLGPRAGSSLGVKVPQSEKKPSHRKSSSYQPEMNTEKELRKSRFDISSIPVIKINQLDLKSEMSKYSAINKKTNTEEQRSSHLEWSNAKKNMKNTIEEDLKSHEFSQTTERILFNKLLKNNEIGAQKFIQRERFDDFIEFNKARQKKKAEQCLREKEDLKVEKEKSLNIQKDVLDKKARIRSEREEQRLNFLEFIKAKKEKDQEDRQREIKEMTYERNAGLIETRNILYSTKPF